MINLNFYSEAIFMLVIYLSKSKKKENIKLKWGIDKMEEPPEVWRWQDICHTAAG